MALKVVAFDAYGTLFDVAAAARNLATHSTDAHFKEHWMKLAEIWRLKQLQYSWLRAITNDYVDFWQVTEDGLDFALEAVGIENADTRKALLDLYWSLDAYAEVPDMLSELKAKGIATAILSNGSKAMLDGAISSAGIADVLDDVLSVEDVEIFKPDDRVYQMVPDRFECSKEEVLLVSSNGWDIAGGSGFGFQTLWVNRAGDPVDRLPSKPDQIAPDLRVLPEMIEGL